MWAFVDVFMIRGFELLELVKGTCPWSESMSGAEQVQIQATVRLYRLCFTAAAQHEAAFYLRFYRLKLACTVVSFCRLPF